MPDPVREIALLRPQHALQRRTLVKRTLWFVCLLSLLLVAGVACKGRGPNAAKTSTTETIAPPAPQPAPTGTDAMTQTVDIEDSRSEDDGGVLTAGPAKTATNPTSAKTKTTKKTKK